MGSNLNQNLPKSNTNITSPVTQAVSPCPIPVSPLSLTYSRGLGTIQDDTTINRGSRPNSGQSSCSISSNKSVNRTSVGTPIQNPTNSESEVELIFDAVLNCYYDPKTNQYYEIQ